MVAYIFAAAAVIAIISVVIVVHLSVNKIIADPTQGVHVQKRFLITVGLSKLIPVALLIVGIAMFTKVDDIADLIIPWSIILGVVGVGIYSITRQKNRGESDDAKFVITTLVTIARPLLFSIPIMAAGFIFLMLK